MSDRLARIIARLETPDLTLGDILDRVVGKGIVIHPTSQLELLEEAPGQRVWVVDDEPLPLVFRQPSGKPC